MIPMEDRVKKFCEYKGIIVSGGAISEKHKRDIQDFISDEMERDRKEKDKQETEIANKFGNIVNNTLKKWKEESGQ